MSSWGGTFSAAPLVPTSSLTVVNSRNYSTPVDIWSVGCIFAEMATSRPLLPGSSEKDQLLKIFEMFGTPSPDAWPGIVDLPEYRGDFPQFPGQNIRSICPRLNDLGLDLLMRMLEYNPARRISAEDALTHPYFQSAPSPTVGATSPDDVDDMESTTNMSMADR